ncbi:MAG: hypothetical protein JO366_04075 [Methylobacteriaceae bacterium]|nr:hypothetical protein [Methylobacteriaceae bacterium]MBV9633156.1 hypothetical protein [Methylobacteriaceae bacterium]MBV9704227.1 hypothetical protein [Methylobacteriaceae bacterium]
MAGRERNLTERALIDFDRSIDPGTDPYCRQELDTIKTALDSAGIWRETQEWRISTWFCSTIERKARDGADWYHVSVECDGQVLACWCPNPEKAFAFYKLYCHTIVYQFYSIGRPWADNRVFRP